MEQTHIIILNWNGGRDTWECVRSVCGLPDVNITIVDNASTDDSVALIRKGLLGLRKGYRMVHPERAMEAITAGDLTTILMSRKNLGFAGGINLVLPVLLDRPEVSYIWLLNNDAIATRDTLGSLVGAMRDEPRLGFAGSLILDARRRNEIQCFGVRYHKWLGVGKMLFKGRDLQSLGAEEIRKKQPDFQHGASLLVRMQTIREIGLLDDRFFLYSEEHDWQTRARKASWKNLRVAESKVFHLGSLSTARDKHLFYYHYCRSSVIYSRKHHSIIVAITASILLSLITMVRTRLHHESLSWGLKGIREAWGIRL